MSLLIVGAANGLARALAGRLAGRYSSIVLIDADPKVREVANEIRESGCAVAEHLLDLRDSSAVDRLFSKVVAEVNPQDCIYLARYRVRYKPTELDPAVLEDEWRVNVQGAALLGKWLLSVPSEKPRSILFLSSILASQVALEQSLGYHCTKAALSQLTRVLAVAGGPVGLRANAIAPGFILADVSFERFYSEGNASYREVAQACHAVRRVGNSKDLFGAVDWLLSPESGFVTGQILSVDGGISIEEPFSAAGRLRGLF